MVHGLLEDLRVRIVMLMVVVGLASAAIVPAVSAEEDATAAAGAAQAMESAPAPPGWIKFVGKNLIMKAKGTFHRWRIVESSIDPASLEDAVAVVEVDLSSVDTGIERRDKHLRTPDFFEVETYPVATVRVHSPRPIEDPKSEHPRYEALFDIDLHGVEKTVEGEIELISADPIVFEGELVIDRTDFGVGPKPSGWSPMTPKAEIPVRFHVEL
ncbi:MAG TPA: YceI family protein [Deltaproteobacteria bacterium]|nr:YceI family protein [Deltaproteobacteria bacterium]